MEPALLGEVSVIEIQAVADAAWKAGFEA